MRRGRSWLFYGLVPRPKDCGRATWEASNAQRPTPTPNPGDRFTASAEKVLIGFDFVARDDEGHFRNRSIFAEKFRCGFDCDFGSIGDRVAVDAATYGGEGDGAQAVLRSEEQGISIAVGERFGFAALAAGPDRTDGVDDEAHGQ